MRAAVLLPGPSLSRLDRLPVADLIICVKRASLRFRGQWAVILDSPDLKRYGDCLLGHPNLLTRAAYRGKYTVLGGLNVEALYDYCPLSFGSTDRGWFTSTAAIVFAGFMHASRINVYGADFGEAGDDAPEFDGFRSPEANYKPERWAQERRAFFGMSAWLRSRVIEVTRINYGIA